MHYHLPALTCVLFSLNVFVCNIASIEWYQPSAARPLSTDGLRICATGAAERNDFRRGSPFGNESAILKTYSCARSRCDSASAYSCLERYKRQAVAWTCQAATGTSKRRNSSSDLWIQSSARLQSSLKIAICVCISQASARR